MAIESKFHRPSDVSRTTVSQGSRNDAKPAGGMKFESYEEERQHFITEKKRIEIELSRFKNMMSKEQSRIRKENRHSEAASRGAWAKRKSQLEDRRVELMSRNMAIEQEIARLRPLVQAEKARSQAEKARSHQACRAARPSAMQLEDFEIFREDGTLSWDGIAAQLLIELRAIRQLLERQGS